MKLCSEMERKGITDPNSLEGVNCCLNCGLARCELEMVDRRKLPGGILYIRKQQVRQLHSGGLDNRIIAEELGISIRTVQRYLEDGN